MPPALVPGTPALLYFAYGANMASATLRKRGVAPLAAQPAVLEDPSLCLSFGHRGGYATVGPQPALGGSGGGRGRDGPGGGGAAAGTAGHRPQLWRSPVHGVLYTLLPEDLQRLQRWEVGYRRSELAVLTYGGGAEGAERRRPAAVFQSSPLLRLRAPVAPTHRYLALLLAGAREHQLAGEHLAWLEALQGVAVPPSALGGAAYSDTPAESAARGLGAAAFLGASAWAALAAQQQQPPLTP